MKKKMDQRQAWRFLAKKWDKPDIVGSRRPVVKIYSTFSDGICLSLKDLYFAAEIGPTLYYTMKNFMHKNKPKDFGQLYTPLYWWSLDMEGAKERAKFCRKMAKICYKKG